MKKCVFATLKSIVGFVGVIVPTVAIIILLLILLALLGALCLLFKCLEALYSYFADKICSKLNKYYNRGSQNDKIEESEKEKGTQIEMKQSHSEWNDKLAKLKKLSMESDKDINMEKSTTSDQMENNLRIRLRDHYSYPLKRSDQNPGCSSKFPFAVFIQITALTLVSLQVLHPYTYNLCPVSETKFSVIIFS